MFPTHRQEIMTTRKFELRSQNRRTHEQKMNELLHYARETQRFGIDPNSRKASVNASSINESQVDNRRNPEVLREEQITIQQVNQQAIQNEMRKQPSEREMLELEIQRICESSDEIRELERQIKLAYVNKERAAQLQELSLIRKVESARNHVIEEEMERRRQHMIKIEEEKELCRRNKLIEQKSVLQDQMKEKLVRFRRIVIMPCIGYFACLILHLFTVISLEKNGRCKVGSSKGQGDC